MRPDALQLPVVAPLRQLPWHVRTAVPIDDEALFEFCSLNRDLRIERTKEGELIIMSPTGSETGGRNFILNGLFFAWVVADGTGKGFDSSTGFLLPNGAERSPDAAWVKKARWEGLTAAQRRRFAPLCPDFVVELRSPADDLGELQAKMEEYILNGALLGWLIDPEAKCVYVYRPHHPVERVEGATSISGQPELPGFELDLNALW
jgi:Uma2 family endonuclease